jgi:hypothetical protein
MKWFSFGVYLWIHHNKSFHLMVLFTNVIAGFIEQKSSLPLSFLLISLFFLFFLPFVNKIQ